MCVSSTVRAKQGEEAALREFTVGKNKWNVLGIVREERGGPAYGWKGIC